MTYLEVLNALILVAQEEHKKAEHWRTKERWAKSLDALYKAEQSAPKDVKVFD
jgi:hypothetical protein